MPALTPATPAEEREFAAAVAAAQRAQFGDQPVEREQRAAFLRGLLVRIDEGYVCVRGEWRQVVVPEMAPDDPRRLKAQQPRKTGPSFGAIAGGIATAILLLGIGVSLLLPSGSQAHPTTGTLVATVITGTVTTLAATSVPPTIAAGFVTADGAEARPIHPNNLDLGGRSFGIYQAPVQQNTWQVSTDPGLANWVPGAILNWSFAIYADHDATPATAAWVNSLQPGTPVTVRVVLLDHTIRTVQFQITERRRIRRTQTEIFNPDTPGVTVAVKDGPGDSWVMVRGVEVVADAPAAAPALAPQGGGRR